MRSIRGMDRLANRGNWLAGCLATFMVLGAGCGDASPSNPGTGGTAGSGGAAANGVGGTGGTVVADPLIGAWEVALPNTTCVFGINFMAAARFALDLICVLPDNTIGLQTQIGSYTAIGDQLRFMTGQATCPDAPKVSGDTFAVTANQLTLTESTGVFVLMRITPGGSAVAKFGCFRAGTFTPSPLAPL